MLVPTTEKAPSSAMLTKGAFAVGNANIYFSTPVSMMIFRQAGQ